MSPAITLFAFLGDYARLVLGTNYFGWFWGFNMVFFLHIGFVLYVMETYFPELKQTPAFTGALDPVAFLAAFVFMPFLNETMTGYNTEPTGYRGFLDRLRRVAMCCRKDYCARAAQALFPLIVHAESFWLHGQRKRAVDGAPFAEASAVLVGRLKAVFGEDDAAGNAEALNLFDTLQAWVSREVVKDPPYMKTHIFLFLFVWFGLWLPVLMWVRLDWQLTLFLFPFISYVLWGTTILRAWLGSPWDPCRPFTDTHHERWADKCREDIIAIARMRTV